MTTTRNAYLTLAVDSSRAEQALRRAARAVQLFAAVNRAAVLARMPYRERRRRGWPHDHQHPSPLAINGHAYHRRQRARKGRR